MKWEYTKRERFGNDALITWLDEMGKEGWELAGIVQVSDIRNLWVFKRPAVPEANADLIAFSDGSLRQKG